MVVIRSLQGRLVVLKRGINYYCGLQDLEEPTSILTNPGEVTAKLLLVVAGIVPSPMGFMTIFYRLTALGRITVHLLSSRTLYATRICDILRADGGTVPVPKHNTMTAGSFALRHPVSYEMACSVCLRVGLNFVAKRIISLFFATNRTILRYGPIALKC
jgi:hypothetical protein